MNYVLGFFLNQVMMVKFDNGKKQRVGNEKGQNLVKSMVQKGRHGFN